MIEHSNLIDKSRLKFSKEKILAISLILPSLILVFVTYLYPAIFTFVISFAEYDIVRLNIKKFVQISRNPGSEKPFRAKIKKIIEFST